MGHGEDRLGVAVAVGRVDVAAYDVVAHQPVNDIGALALRSAHHERVPEQLALVDEGVGADALTLAEVLERVAGVERGAAHGELLPVAGGVQPLGFAAVDLGQLEIGRHANDAIVRRLHVLEREVPVRRPVDLRFRDALSDTRHARDPDAAAEPHDRREDRPFVDRALMGLLPRTALGGEATVTVDGGEHLGQRRPARGLPRRTAASPERSFASETRFPHGTRSRASSLGSTPARSIPSRWRTALPTIST